MMSSRGASEQYSQATATPVNKDTLANSELDLADDREKQAYNLLCGCTFANSCTIQTDLLTKTGLNEDFAEIWKAI